MFDDDKITAAIDVTGSEINSDVVKEASLLTTLIRKKRQGQKISNEWNLFLIRSELKN